MNKTTRSFLWILLYLILILNLDQLPSNTQPWITLPPLFYFFTSAVVILCLFIPPLRQIAQPLSMLAFSIVYIALRFITKQNIVPPYESDYLYRIIIELILLNLGIFLTYRFTKYFSEFEDLINTSIIGQSKRQLFELSQVSDVVEREFNRGRRYNYPISALVIDSKVNRIEQINATPNLAIEEVAQNIRANYLSARLIKFISEQIRQSDMIVKLDKGSRILVLFPETPPENARMLAKRLQERTIHELGISFPYSLAAFPQDALTFRALLSKMENDLTTIMKTEKEINGQSRQQSLQPK